MRSRRPGTAACLLSLMLLAVAVPCPASAQQRVEAIDVSPTDAVLGGAAPRLVFFPSAPAPGQDRWAIGGVWQIAPMFTANYRRGLGSGFALDARASSIIVYNQLGVGASWSTTVGPFQLGLMGHFDGYYGQLGQSFVDSETSGFDSSGWGILLEPGVLAGLKVANDSWLTLIVEGFFQPYQAQKLGSLVISPGAPVYSGGRASVVVEHLWGQGALYYGASLYHTTMNYPIWFNVNYSTAKMFYLGILGGYEF